MIRGTTDRVDSTWDEATIHELLGQESAHMYSLKPANAAFTVTKSQAEFDAISISTSASDSLPASPQTRKKRTHRKLSAKERVVKGGELKLMPSVPSAEAVPTARDQTNTIRAIGEAIQQHEAEMAEWVTPQPMKKSVCGAYSLQQKKEILAQLQGRIVSIESSIVAARDALEKIIQFM